MMDATNGIAGHEGAGTVAAVHPDVADIWKVGDRVGVKCKSPHYLLPILLRYNE